MAALPCVVRTVKDLRHFVQKKRKAGKTVGLVPTMGALHHGHLSLITEISKHVDVAIVSIFVNPTQFGKDEDFDTYPRQERSDLEKLAGTKAALVYAPNVDEMYPNGDKTMVSVSSITNRFEGKARPGHFDGVATVVCKLLLQCLPDAAIFGEKDFQQLAVIRQFTRDLAIPVTILGGPIIREADGLAASSRNAYLSLENRAVAGQLNRVLQSLVASVKNGGNIQQAEETAISALLNAGFDAVDYVAVVDPATLEPMPCLNQNAQVLAVARINGVRLLDTMAIEAPR